MCGIFGFVSKENSELETGQKKKIVNTLFKLSESRGKEASGFAMKNSNEISIYKTPYPATTLIKSDKYKNKLNKICSVGNETFVIGHSRLVTNGYEELNINNQPVIKNETIGIHNGIVVNVDELWKQQEPEKKKSELDSELIFFLLRKYKTNSKSVTHSIFETYKQIYGMTTIAFVFSEYNNLFLSTNNGSLYYLFSKQKKSFIFASERYILTALIKKQNLNKYFDTEQIKNLKSKTSCSLNLKTLSFELYETGELNKIKDFSNLDINPKKNKIIDLYGENNSYKKNTKKIPIVFNDYFEKCSNKINEIKRCTSCLLPETFPFIEFNNTGECNFCKNHKNFKVFGADKLTKLTNEFIKHNEKHNVLIPLSGGRDSCYSLHYAKKELGLNPIAFSYDWGMLTDLARRNQARLCGKLGVEHILISADIRKKRKNIRKNVLAWLKRPELGTIPLFMAGDKQYFYYAHKLKKDYKIDLTIMGENPFEKTMFKTGFTGAKQDVGGSMAYHINNKNKIRMSMFYAKEFVKNPQYINSSVLDTLGAFFSYYFIPHDYLNLFDYLYWDEEEIETVLFDKYDWEISPDTSTTWRIGDGTTAFYNYIYYIIAGFTENDTFRSNQIREGVIDRNLALQRVNDENKIQWNSIKQYCKTINIDFETTIRTINKIPKLY